jgi:hypothetical protein
MQALRPSLATVEARLCGPSDALLEKYCNDPDSLSRDLRKFIDADEAAQDRIRQISEMPQIESKIATEPLAVSGPSLAQISELHDLLDRREAARKLQQTQEPMAGQIRLVDRIVGPAGPVQYDLPSPLAVVLGERVPDRPDVWYGWMAAPDPDYASPWDLILEQDVADPLAAVVQCWNSVLIYAETLGAVIGQLSEATLSASRALADDYAFGPDTDPQLAEPGRLVYRQIAGHKVLTGTPLGHQDEDPRLEYQLLYHDASEPIRTCGHEALGLFEEVSPGTSDAPTSLGDQIRRIIESLRAQTLNAGFSFQEEPLVAMAASAPSAQSQRAYNLGDIVRLIPEERRAGDAEVVHFRMERILDETVGVEILDDGVPTIVEDLTDARPSIEFMLSTDARLVVRIKSPIELELELPVSR